MKKLFLLILVLSFLALPVAAQGPTPEPIYLPLIWRADMGCGSFQILEISDGTTTVNFLSDKSGFYLTDWEPSLAEAKGGGTWKDSTLAEGRTLGMRQRANAIDTLNLAVRDWTPDDLIQDTQDLRRLLEKAYAYDTTSWQDEPVWVKRHPVGATNAEYTIIHDYRTPQDGNPHGSDTFWTNVARAGFHEFVLVLEHEGFWRACQPGTGSCVQASGQQMDWEYSSWVVNTALPTGDVTEFLEASCGNMLAADWSGGAPEIWRTANGTVWNAAATPPTAAPAALLESSDGFLYAACSASEIWRSGDCGVNWVQRSAVHGAQYHMTLAELGSYLYLVKQPSYEIRRSNDGGATWNVVFTGPPTPQAICQADDGYLYVSGGGGGVPPPEIIWRSNDGTTWNQVFHNPVSGAASVNLGMIKQLSDGYIYAGGRRNMGVNQPTLFRSANGTDWGLIATFPGVTEVSNIILASNGYYYLLLANGELYRGAYPTDWKFVIDIGGASTLGLIEYSGNNGIYAGEAGDIWWNPNYLVDMGRSATCDEEVYVANKQNIAQLTHVKTYDASGVPPDDYLDRFPAGAFPYQLLPAVMANTDAVYFGIQTVVFDSGPFDNIVLDLSTPASGTYTVTWQYSDGFGGWPNLNVMDNTSSFNAEGVNSVHWVPPSDWAPEAVDGVTAYWVLALIGGVAGNPVGPQQDNRDPYTVNWPRVDIDEEQVTGDIPALLQFKFHNQSDEDGYIDTLDELDTLENRVVVGLRSLDRGYWFTAYLNCSDEQNPFGITAADGANTTDVDDIDHPTGRSMEHTTTGLSTWTDECTFTLDPSIAGHFYGSFHAYFRGQEEDWDSEIDEVRVRLQVRTGSGGVTFTTDHKPFRNLNNWQLLDLGGVDIPASGLFSSSDLGDETELVIQIWSSASSLTVNLYDLILIPTDEWALDAVDKALEDDSGVANGYLLDVDSVTYPKRDIRTLVRAVGSGYIRSVYQPNKAGPAILQANADQRLWTLTARGMLYGAHTGANNATTLTDANNSFLTSGVESGQVIFNVTDSSVGTVGATVTATTISDCGLTGGTDNDWDTGDVCLIICPNWRSEPWNAHSVQVWANARYLSMRGAR